MNELEFVYPSSRSVSQGKRVPNVLLLWLDFMYDLAGSLSGVLSLPLPFDVEQRQCWPGVSGEISRDLMGMDALHF